MSSEQEREQIGQSVAIAHKDYDTRGGGEVFVRRLAEHLDAPIVTGRRNQTNEPDADLDIREIALSGIEERLIDRGGLGRTLAYALRWPAAHDELAGFDTVITSGNEPLWWIPDDDQTVIAYTHSTPRFMYDLFNETTDFSGAKSRLKALFYQVQRVVYESNVRRPDVWVANSELVARRMELYWNLDPETIEVVHPPVDTHHFNPDAAPTQDFYLHLGRLAGHKRVGEVIEAWHELDAPLVVAGDGPERDALEAAAPANVDFRGFVDESEKRRLMSSARALVYPPANEDFGMVPIEALAAGTPVIGVRDGFTRFQLRDGDCGVLWDRGDLREAVARFEREGVAWTPHEIAEYATTNWSIERFHDEIDAVIAAAREQTAIDVDLEAPLRGFEYPDQPAAATDGGGDA